MWQGLFFQGLHQDPFQSAYVDEVHGEGPLAGGVETLGRDSGRGQNRTLIGRQGEIRDRSSEGQHYRMAGLNLLAAIVIYWNSAHLGEAVRQRKHAGLTVEPELLDHILLTGEYRWPKRR